VLAAMAESLEKVHYLARGLLQRRHHEIGSIGTDTNLKACSWMVSQALVRKGDFTTLCKNWGPGMQTNESVLCMIMAEFKSKLKA
jgi:hypothetical protein